MMYVICNKFGEPKDDMDKISHLDSSITKVQDFGLQDKGGNAIDGYLLTIDGAVLYAIADGGSTATPIEDPPTPFIDAKAEPFSD